jgi:drug/metabolite transporter (DMT)-like permease
MAKDPMTKEPLGPNDEPETRPFGVRNSGLLRHWVFRHSSLVRAATPRSAYLLMFASAAAFAAMSACSHALAARCDWRLVAVARGGIAFVLTAWLARATGVRVVFRWPRTLWMRSVVGSLSMLFTFYALTGSDLPVSTAVTLFNTFPIWVTLLAWPVLRERPSAAFLVALASSVIGVVLIEQGLPAETSGLSGVGSPRGAIASALLAAVCTAIVMLGLHRLRAINSLAIVVHFSGVATVAVVGFAAVTALNGWPIDLAALRDPVTAALLAGVGGLATIGQLAMTRAFSLGRPQRLAVVGLTQVVFVLAFDVALWGYRLEPANLAGLALILGPVAWLVGRRRP